MPHFALDSVVVTVDGWDHLFVTAVSSLTAVFFAFAICLFFGLDGLLGLHAISDKAAQVGLQGGVFPDQIGKFRGRS